MIKVVAKGKLKSGVNPEDYLVLAKELVSETRKEEGCIEYTLHQDINDPSIFTMLEKWVDLEFIQKHDKSEHVARLVPDLRKMREYTEINHYKEV